MNRSGGVAKTLWKYGRLFSVLESNDHYCHPAVGILDSNGFLTHAICLYFLAKVTRQQRIEQGHTVQDQDHASITPSFCHWCCVPDWVAITKFKRAFSDFSQNSTPAHNMVVHTYHVYLGGEC